MILYYSICIYICHIYLKTHQNIFVFKSKSEMLIFRYILWNAYVAITCIFWHCHIKKMTLQIQSPYTHRCVNDFGYRKTCLRKLVHTCKYSFEQEVTCKGWLVVKLISLLPGLRKGHPFTCINVQVNRSKGLFSISLKYPPFCRSSVYFYPLICPLNPLKCPSPSHLWWKTVNSSCHLTPSFISLTC